jgi:hypothetical protein
MAVALGLFFLFVSAAMLVLMRQWLRRQNASPRVLGSFSLIVLAGSVIGVWLSMRAELAVGPRTRFVGAPLPLVVWQKESDGQWRDFPHPRPVMALLLMANAGLVAAALAGPLALSQALGRRSTTTSA